MTDRLIVRLPRSGSGSASAPLKWGETGDPTGPYTGLKIAFERIPTLEEVELFVGVGRA